MMPAAQTLASELARIDSKCATLAALTGAAAVYGPGLAADRAAAPAGD
jgi:hypothetical protein